MGLLDGKVALVTGAGGGLGKAYAILFASEGAKVVVNDLGGAMDGSGDGGNAMADVVVGEIVEAGGEAIANYASVSDEAGAQSMIDDAIEAFGRLDVVMSNAGILRDKSLLKLDTPNFDIVMAVHARGTFLVGKAAATAMKELGNGGSIINTSSISGLKGNFGQTNYACAKAGIAGMTRTWGQELVRYGIRTNAIAPMAKTRMTEDISAVPEDILPEDIAPMALYLATDLAKDVNGRIFGCHGRHIFEYHQELSPGVELPEGRWTAQQIHERLAEISELPRGAPAADGDGEQSPKAICDEIFAGMAQVFLPEKAGDWQTVIHFDITGTGSWGANVGGGKCAITGGKPDGIQCTITYDSAQTLIDTMTGKANAQQAFMGGKIKADNMGDLMKFAQCFDTKKAAELMKQKRGGSKGPSVHEQIDRVFEGMGEYFLPEKAEGWNAVIHFDITGTGSYTVLVTDGQCTTSKGAPESATCTITYDSGQTMVDTITGKTNAQQAFMGGKIKADNMADLMKFAQAFDMKRAARERAATKAESGGDDSPARGMNRDCIGQSFRTAAEFVYPEQTKAYALATNDRNEAYLGDGDVVAPTIFPVRPLLRACHEAVITPDLRADLLRLVHGEQDMIFHAPLKPWDLVAARAEITDITEKKSGELIEITQRLMRDGEVVCEAKSGYFIRALRKPGDKKVKKVAAETPARETLFEATYPVDDDQTYRYAEASTDNNPIHVDPKVAKAAGHPNVIAHGLCTMAMTTREVVDNLCDGDPSRLKRMKVRFSKIVLPGDELTTRAWLVEETDSTKTVGLETINQNGENVISNALAEIRL